MNNIRIALLALFFLVASFSFTQNIEPATEIRAVWLTTNWKLDWPRHGASAEEQMRELDSILDELQKSNFNVVLFQARAQGKVFYHSMLEDSSPFFNSSTHFDPLAYAIAGCHARGMECHAWITTFPVERAKVSASGALLEKRPSYYKRSGKDWFLDPGRSETKDILVAIAQEIVTRYDVDGLHLDYIRYPDNAHKFADNDTYKMHGRGKNKAQWRRQNVNSVVFAIYDAVKSIKNWVQVSSSPIGKYKALSRYDGWTAYESAFQDAGYWMQEGKHDLLFPMMYSRNNGFYPHVDQWLAASNDRPIVPGLAAYQLEENPKDWTIEDIDSQIEFTRAKETAGQAYFRTAQILDNTQNLKTTVNSFYKYPAKLPALTWLHNDMPEVPIDFEVFRDESGMLVMQWDAPNSDERYTYNVYFSRQPILDMDSAEGLLVANWHKNHYSFAASVGEYGFYYFVTASDRYHNESYAAESVFFVHSETPH